MSQIANYWAWDLERLKYIGLVFHFLGLLMFVSLWWNQDRAWRPGRWFLAIYFVLLGVIRFSLWMLTAVVSPSPTPLMRAFLMKSGVSGFILCIAAVIFIILDHKKNWIRFTHFSPEDWSRETPTAIQWTGLVIAMLALWSPYVPNPISPGLSLFAWGFPTSFGVTLTPVLLFLGGIILAGNRRPVPVPAICLGLGTAASSLVVDPITLHGVIIAIIGLAIAITGFLSLFSKTKT